MQASLAKNRDSARGFLLARISHSLHVSREHIPQQYAEWRAS